VTPTPPTHSDAYFLQLHLAGWTIGEVKHGAAWVVSGRNGENVINATGATQTEAWRRAAEQGAAVGMLTYTSACPPT
jgi:hypothetical protein